MAAWLFLALLTKHFVADFPLQFPRHYLAKGIYGRWGGYEHVLIHAALTFLVLVFFRIHPVDLIVALSCGEAFAHYHIDWAKMNLNRHWNLKPDNSEKFWWLLGFDQWLHHATYAAIVLIVVT